MKATARRKMAPKRAPARRAAARPAARGVPPGYHTVTPSLIVRNAAAALDFYARAFGAKERLRMPGPDGTSIMHAELTIGDSVIFVRDEAPAMGARSPHSLGGEAGSLHLYVADVDLAFKRAVAAGAQARMPVRDMFWGDRFGAVVDPFGHEWGLATRVEDLTAAETARRARAFFQRAATAGDGHA
jgi:PhnB protein